MNLEEITQIRTTLKAIQNDKNLGFIYRQGHILYLNGQSQLLTQAKNEFEFSVNDAYNDFSVKIFTDDKLGARCTCQSDGWCHHQIACLLQLHDELSRHETTEASTGKLYTRQGMIKRVLKERQERAKKADYTIDFSDNIYGEHILYNEKKKAYHITFRDFKQEIGYCTCPDFQTNKLGTCKHLMYAFSYVKKNKQHFFTKRQGFPFVDIYLDPLHNYQISWYYTGDAGYGIKKLIYKYFKEKRQLPEIDITDFLGFIREAEEYKQILIRPEVHRKVENAFTEQIMLQVEANTKVEPLINEMINGKLFPYQTEGVQFATFREGAIIADQMGLGKTVQAIATAVLKRKLFGFKRTLIICPASIKEQWKNEIARFANEKALIVEGTPNLRRQVYSDQAHYFIIANYEAVLRDYKYINQNPPDFIILDEAQRIKNYETRTTNAIRNLQKKHALIITGTPIENKLIDLYSVVNFVDHKFLSPLWEFSYQHCYFDTKSFNKITGYYNLNELKEKMAKILIRREKHDVLKQLPSVSQLDIPVQMSNEQFEYHSSYARGIASILHKKYISPFDLQRIMLLLSKMRMVCDSTYLVDSESNISPKITELEHILLEKLNVKENERKIIIFSEWKKMNFIIAKMLRDNNIGFVELNGSVPVKKRGNLIREFETNPKCRVFVSTEAGGTGLNLQAADTVINFELPWNPAKKNQRIGRIDRLGQLSKNLTVISLITENSIESQISVGLLLKQSLFDSVLNLNFKQDEVDFSSEGRAQFLKQLEEAITEIEEIKEPEAEEPQEEAQEEIQPTQTAEADDLQTKTGKTSAQKEKAEQAQTTDNKQVSQDLEAVMRQGMGFLSGLFKMATGKDLGMENQSIQVDKETGEVTMKFKLPQL